MEEGWGGRGKTCRCSDPDSVTKWRSSTPGKRVETPGSQRTSAAPGRQTASEGEAGRSARTRRLGW